MFLGGRAVGTAHVAGGGVWALGPHYPGLNPILLLPPPSSGGEGGGGPLPLCEGPAGGLQRVFFEVKTVLFAAPSLCLLKCS